MKKIFIIIAISLALLKLADLIFVNFIGMGNPLIYRHSKIFGYDLQPDQKIKRRGNIIKINDLGMRSSNDWGKDKYNKKILFIGDSVTFGGSIVSNEDTFVEKICDKINDTNVICGNYAVNGYGIEAIINRIKYKKFNDENLLVITVIGNDFERGLLHIVAQPYYSKKISNFYPALTEIFFIFFDKFRTQIKYDPSNIHESDSIYKDYQLNTLKEFSNTILELKKNYIIFYSPSKSEFTNPYQYSDVKKYLGLNFKNFVDLTPELINFKEEIYYDDIHLNKIGHDIYSNIMLKKINKKF